MHYYKRNIGDYSKKAGRLSMAQHGAYTLLIDACYDREQFPTEHEAIDWIWASSTEEVEAVKFVLSKFFTLEDGRYVQSRIQEELNDYHGKAETNARIAREREAKRRESYTNRERTVNEPPPNHKPITTNQEPEENPPTPLEGEEPAKPSRKFDPIEACPENVTPEVWADWVKFRKELRKPLTETSCERQAKELAGHSSPDQVILTSISAGWQGLFPDRISNVTPIHGGKPTRPALKPGEFYDFDWDDKNPATHKIYHSDTHDPTTGYAWVWLKKQTWYRP